MTYDEALEYIHGISWTFCKPGLERIGELCERLGHPEDRLKFVHIAGTNGKGSTSAMVSSVLKAAGYKVGLYTSPYIVEFVERMRINGENIDKDTLAQITEQVKPIAESMTDKPTEFELITAIAFEYFAREGADIVVLEAGMGGRLDSTNIIKNALVSVITGIALDHTAFLGDTVEKIAAEKAGIIKPSIPVIYGGRDKGAEEVIKGRAKELSSPFTTVGHGDIRVKESTLSGTVFDYKGYTDIKIPLLGAYQPENAALVLEICEALRCAGLSIPDGAIRSGLSSVRWPARFEIIGRDPLIIFDGAHNPQGIESAVKSILTYFEGERVFTVSGVLRDKDYGYIAGELARVSRRVYTLTPDNPRALSAEEYAREIEEKGVPALPYPSVKAALESAIKDAASVGGAVVCLGSLYTYGEVIKALKEIQLCHISIL